jgi:hypothetical protein
MWNLLQWWEWLGHSKPPTPIKFDEPKGHVQFKGNRLGQSRNLQKDWMFGEAHITCDFFLAMPLYDDSLF